MNSHQWTAVICLGMWALLFIGLGLAMLSNHKEGRHFLDGGGCPYCGRLDSCAKHKWNV